jgi:NAD(P)-dependent dehydrogenase (short-subunit alcohol dehydrogenase family)
MGLADAAYAAFGKVNIVVNNAGSSPLAPSSLATPEQLFDRIVSLTFKGPFRLMSLVGSRIAAGEGGSIINISSAGALRPRPQIAPYAGAKAALTETCALEADVSKAGRRSTRRTRRRRSSAAAGRRRS